MFPSLAALGGTLGLLGLRERELVGDELLANLNRGYQRHIDCCPVDYAALMRDPSSGYDMDPVAETSELGPPAAEVVLVGGGIANIIAAYELSRIGIRCTVLEASDRIGGRLRSDRLRDTSTAWSESGAVRFPRGGLMWHYVAQWVEAQGSQPFDGPDPGRLLPQPRHRADHAHLPGKDLRLEPDPRRPAADRPRGTGAVRRLHRRPQRRPAETPTPSTSPTPSGR